MDPSSATLPRATIAHLLPGRIRLHFPAQRGDAAFFSRLTDSLREAPLIREVRANARTGSLVLLHATDVEGLIRLARERGLFTMTTTPLRNGPAPEQARQQPRAIRPLAVASLGFAGLGAMQTLRGRFHGNAAESLWNAYLIHAVQGRPAASAALVALGLFQLVNGRVLGSGVSLFLYALVARNLGRVRLERSPR